MNRFVVGGVCGRQRRCTPCGHFHYQHDSHHSRDYHRGEGALGLDQRLRTRPMGCGASLQEHAMNSRGAEPFDCQVDLTRENMSEGRFPLHSMLPNVWQLRTDTISHMFSSAALCR